MKQHVDVGDPFPDFSLPDQDGRTVTRADLLGQPCVVYIYPKDETPGCTHEACDFQAAIGRLQRSKIRVVGVSPDRPASHRRFREQHGLEFTLLADVDHSLARACGVWAKKQRFGQESLGIVRSTFLVGADGTVQPLISRKPKSG